MKQLVLASSNAGKLAEFNRLLADAGITVVSQASLGVEDAEETGLTFVENALLKAHHAAQVTGLPALTAAMEKHGYNAALMKKLTCDNWVSVLDRTWKD